MLPKNDELENRIVLGKAKQNKIKNNVETK